MCSVGICEHVLLNMCWIVLYSSISVWDVFVNVSHLFVQFDVSLFEFSECSKGWTRNVQECILYVNYVSWKNMFCLVLWFSEMWPPLSYEDFLSIAAVQFNDLCFHFDSFHFTFFVQREAIIRFQVSATATTQQNSPWHRFTSRCCTVWGKNFSYSERKNLISILFVYFLFGLANKKYIDISYNLSLIQIRNFRWTV